MKIYSEDQNRLILKQKNIPQLFAGVILALLGVGVLIIANQSVLFAWIIGGIFSLIGIYVIVTSKFLTISIDKTHNLVRFTSVGILGKESKAININQIANLSLEENYYKNVRRMGSRNRISYMLVFYMHDGQSMPIPIDIPNGLTINKLSIGGLFSSMKRNKNIELSKKIAAFIGVPFTHQEAPSLKELIKDGNKQANMTSSTNKIPKTLK